MTAKKSSNQKHAIAPMLLREWDYRDPVGWTVQEKYDGVRLVWDGAQLWTRTGRRVDAPAWFIEGLPVTPLDGELWFGRQSLGRALSAIQGGSWADARFVVFDLPAQGIELEERLRQIAGIELPKHAFAAPCGVCSGSADLEDRLDEVATRHGEGLVLRQPGTCYEGKRSGSARKLRL